MAQAFVQRSMGALNVYVAMFIWVIQAFFWKLVNWFFPNLGPKKPRIVCKNANNPYSSYGRVDSRFAGHYAFQATTIPQLMILTVENNDREKPALGYRPVRNCVPVGTAIGESSLGKVPAVQLVLEDYCWLNLGQVEQLVGKLARAFVSQGIAFQERVLIYAETRPEWFLCAQALWRVGATVTTLFSTLGKLGILSGITETEVEHIITTRDLLGGLLEIISQLPKVRFIYVLEQTRKILPISIDQIDFSAFSKVKLINYADLLEMGQNVTENQIFNRQPKADDVAIVMYTSGSTGTPKGVIQTHRNFLAVLHGFFSSFGSPIMSKARRHTYYAFLPLAHIVEMLSEVGLFGAGFQIGYGSPLTMVSDSPGMSPGIDGDLTLLRPTVISAVPLVLERIRGKLNRRLGTSAFKKAFLQGIIKYKIFCRNLGVETPLVNWLVCQKAQASLGGRLQTMIVGGAPLGAKTQEIIENLFNIRVLLGYGATETCGASFLSDSDDFSLGTTSIFHGLEYRIIDWKAGGYLPTNVPNPRGELLIGGPSVALGYFKKPQLTAEYFSIDDKGRRWFKTGDIVEVLPDGTIKVIDRKKDLVKLANGEYVSLGKIEGTLKIWPLLEHVAVFASLQSDFLVAFLVVNENAIRQMAPKIPKMTSLESLCQNSAIQKRVYDQFRNFCAQSGLAAVETPRRLHLIAEQWTPANGFLTASLKISRETIRAAYKDALESLFKL